MHKFSIFILHNTGEKNILAIDDKFCQYPILDLYRYSKQIPQDNNQNKLLNIIHWKSMKGSSVAGKKVEATSSVMLGFNGQQCDNK